MRQRRTEENIANITLASNFASSGDGHDKIFQKKHNRDGITANIQTLLRLTRSGHDKLLPLLTTLCLLFYYHFGYRYPYHDGPRSPRVVDVLNCPLHPPPGYPQEYPILEVLQTWPVTNLDPPTPVAPHEGICIFDFLHESSNNPQRIKEQVQNYRRAEVPFVVRNDPAVLKAVQKWRNPGYLQEKLGQDQRYLATLSNSTLMTYYAMNPDYNVIPENFEPPTRDAEMTFAEWYQRATADQNNNKAEYAYLRLDACWENRPCDSVGRGSADFIYQDLSFFQPSSKSSLYAINASATRGIQCRLGSPGLTAEMHFDNERNYLSLLHGHRRYLLAHPRNCPTLDLYPMKHPLERHTKVDLAHNPSHSIADSTINQFVLQAGDVLYLPTYWFHHIVSLDVNYQCNTRSGYSVEYDQTIYDCGFFYDFPE